MALMLLREAQPGDSVEPNATPRVALVFALVCLVLVALGIAVRVRNISRVQLQDLIIGRGHYGSVDAGSTSPYQSWGPVYEHSRVSFRVGGQRLSFIPEDHVGERPFKSGEVTFVIDVTGQAPYNQFTVEVVQE